MVLVAGVVAAVAVLAAGAYAGVTGFRLYRAVRREQRRVEPLARYVQDGADRAQLAVARIEAHRDDTLLAAQGVADRAAELQVLTRYGVQAVQAMRRPLKVVLGARGLFR